MKETKKSSIEKAMEKLNQNKVKKVAVEIWGWLLLENGREIYLDGYSKNAIKSLMKFNPDEIIRYGEEELEEEANIYVIYHDKTKKVFTGLDNVKGFFKTFL